MPLLDKEKRHKKQIILKTKVICYLKKHLSDSISITYN